MKDVAAKTEFITIAPMMKKNNNKQQSKSFFDELAEFFGGSGESKDVSEGYLTKRKTPPKMEKELMEVSQSIECMDETTLKNRENLLPLTVSEKQEEELTKQQQDLKQQEEQGGTRGAAAAPLLLEVATEVVAGPPPPPTEEERPGETVTEETVVATREVAEVRAVSAPLVVGADGVRSAVRAALARDPQAAARGCRNVEYPQRNTRVYKTIPLRIPDSWRKDVNYSARTKSGINIDALPSKGGVFVGVVLFKPENTRVSDLKTGAEARALFEEVFPQFADIITDEDYENFVKKPVSKLPEFTYTKSVLNKQGCGVLVGDTIHTVKPYFGLGLNSAFEDISYLDDCLNEANDDMEAALEAYSQKRAKNAEVLVKISHSLDGGFFSFVLPLILDSITNKIAPKLFAPNTIRMLQREDMSFIQVLRRKRMDRAMQAAIGAAALAGLCKAVIFLYSSVFKLLLRFAFAGLASGF
uniref:FAD-binding domain-containing protein n=1 Tax=Heterosigma akashiwo TaxID=2829 RepID=A0A7S3XVC1_HETAK